MKFKKEINLKIVLWTIYTIFFCAKNTQIFSIKNIKSKKAKSSSNTWPAFILTTLTTKNVFKIYGNKIWQSIPLHWQYWWVDTLTSHFPEFNNISIYEPPPIFID